MIGLKGPGNTEFIDVGGNGQNVSGGTVWKNNKTTHHGEDVSDEDIPLRPSKRQKTSRTK